MYGYRELLVSDTLGLVVSTRQDSVWTRLRLLFCPASKLVTTRRVQVNLGSKAKWHSPGFSCISAIKDLVCRLKSWKMSLRGCCCCWLGLLVGEICGNLIRHLDLSGLSSPARHSFTSSTVCLPNIPMNLLLRRSSRPNWDVVLRDK